MEEYVDSLQVTVLSDEREKLLETQGELQGVMSDLESKQGKNLSHIKEHPFYTGRG